MHYPRCEKDAAAMPALHAHVHCKCDKYRALASVACKCAHVWAFLVFFADCLEIGTCFLLRPSHAALCRLQLIARGLLPIANCTWPNPNQELLIACGICPSGIARCCVCLCGLQPVNTHAGGGGILVEIKPSTIAENFTTQRHSQR